MRTHRGGHQHGRKRTSWLLVDRADANPVWNNALVVTGSADEDEGAQSPWGRVAPDGTVYVRTDDGERAVGSWHAGSPAEGLAHYSRRYADLATEVELLAQRMASGAADPRSTLAAVRRLREALPTAAVVGDLVTLAARLDEVQGAAEQRQEAARAQRAAQAADALARKTQLAEEAERLAASGTQWKAAGDRLRDIATEWKEIRGVDRRTEAELWKRLTAARTAFTRRRGAHFAQLDEQRKDAQLRKEQLVAEAETLADSTEWAATGRRLKDLMAEWKAAPRAGRDTEDDLWKRFRAAQDRFFTRRSEVFAERDAATRTNVNAREQLIAEAERLDLSDPRAAQDRLREIQARYEKSGRVPRESATVLDARMRAAEQRVRASVDEQWRRSSASSNPLLDQMREQVSRAEAQLKRARTAGDPRAIREAEAAVARRREFLDQAERTAR